MSNRRERSVSLATSTITSTLRKWTYSVDEVSKEALYDKIKAKI